MNDAGHEDTLELSLVDGITCGLAAALLLLIIFGINIAAPTLSLGGTSGHGTFGKSETGLTGEPVDMVVEIRGAVSVFSGSGFADPLDSDAPQDRTESDANTERMVFVRELRKGYANTTAEFRNQIRFRLVWKGAETPRGVVHIFRSGAHYAFEFNCEQLSASYDLIKDFDLKRGQLLGSCRFVRR